jgi:hypothetical protein
MCVKRLYQSGKTIFTSVSHTRHTLQLLTKGDIMSTGKKLGISILWFALYAGAILLVEELQHIGTTWINTAGGLRAIVLALLVVGSLVPFALGMLVWFNYPKRLYAKLR